MILERFLSIGFKFTGYDEPGAGKSFENISISLYKYYPSYMKDTHYTLILFKSTMSCFTVMTDYRLYIHNNSDGSFVDSPFQISDYVESNKDLINKNIDEIFKLELRDKKITNLLYGK